MYRKRFRLDSGMTWQELQHRNGPSVKVVDVNMSSVAIFDGMILRGRTGVGSVRGVSICPWLIDTDPVGPRVRMLSELSEHFSGQMLFECVSSLRFT
jgi:hypothetical protein